MRPAFVFAIGVMSYITLSGAGCVPDAPAPTVMPAERCMRPVEKIPRPVLGEDGNAYKKRLIIDGKNKGSVIRCLQKFARTVTE